MNSLAPFIALAVGLGFGGLWIWLLLRAKMASAISAVKAEFQAQVAGLTERVAAKEQQIAMLQSALAAEEDQKTQLAMQLQQEATTRAAAEATANRVPHLEGRVAELQSQSQGQQEQNVQLTERLKSLDEKLVAERHQIEVLQEKFQRDFEAVANRLLVDNASRFGQQSVENLEKLLTPFRENLKEFKAKLDTVQQDTAAHSALLKDQIARIGSDAANLTRALKGDVKVLGNWGENMLDQILETSGLQLGVHYRRQSAVKDEAGDQRYLDVVIDLPEEKHLIIDSKVSLRAYEEYVNSPDEVMRSQRLEAHIDCIRNHFRGLGAKRYQDSHGITAPDFVLMYIPIEAAFFVAVGQEPGLFSEALDKNVVLITNSTLLATLRTVAHVWRLADQQKYAIEIADRGGKLYDKFVGFVTDLQDIGAALQRAHEVWEEANKKLHQGPGNLVGQAEKLRTLGVKASKRLPAHLTAEPETESAPLAGDDNGPKEQGSSSNGALEPRSTN